MDFYDRSRHYDLFYGFFSCLNNPSAKFDTKLLEEKEEHLRKFRALFAVLLRDYPDSDWAGDCEKRIREIDYMLDAIRKNSRQQTGN